MKQTFAQKQKRMHYFWPSTLYKYNNEFYLKRPFIPNELTKYFALNFYCKVEKINNFDEKKFQKVNDSINVIDFFDHTSPIKFLKKIRYYKNTIDQMPSNDFYFILYPYKRTSIILAYLLRHKKLTIWVKSLSGTTHIPHPNSVINFAKKVSLPFRKLLYKSISKYIFSGNLIFYTSDVIFDKNNHINQQEIISLSKKNTNKSLVKDDKTKGSICYVGGESLNKGLHVLLKALHKIPSSNRPQLNIIGLQKLKSDKLRKLASSLDVQFHGVIYQRDLFFKKLAKNDILVMPSFAEKQGKVQLEAMSVGVVPICSDSGGTYRTIDNYYNGLLFPPGQSQELARKIELLYENDGLYKQLQENGLGYIAKLSPEKQINKLVSIIHNHWADNC